VDLERERVFVHDVRNAQIHHNVITHPTVGIGINAWTRNLTGEQVYAMRFTTPTTDMAMARRLNSLV